MEFNLVKHPEGFEQDYSKSLLTFCYILLSLCPHNGAETGDVELSFWIMEMSSAGEWRGGIAVLIRDGLAVGNVTDEQKIKVIKKVGEMISDF